MLISRHRRQGQEKNTPHDDKTYQWDCMRVALIACLCLYRQHILASGKEGTAPPNSQKKRDTSRPSIFVQRIDVATCKPRAAVTTATTSMITSLTNVPRPGGSPGTAPAAPSEIPPWLQREERGNGMHARRALGFEKKRSQACPAKST